MKNFYVLFLLIVTTSVCAQTTLLLDDFETGYTAETEIQSTDSSWATYGTDYTFPAKNTSAAGAETSDWYVRMERGGTVGFAYVERVYELIAGKTYVFKASVLPDNSNQKSAYKLKIMDINTQVAISTILSTGLVWEELTVSYTAAATKNYKFRINKQYGHGASFDSVEIKCTDCDPPTPTSFDGTTWNNGDPIGTTNLDLAVSITSGLVTFTGISSFKSLTINAGASATLQTDNSITTVDGIVLNAGASLIAEGNSTVNGAVTYNRTVDFVSGNLKGWYLMASPVAHAGFSVDTFTAENEIATNGTNRGIATYGTSVDSWSYFQAGTTRNFLPGKGYSIKKASTTGTVSFTGTLNTDNVTVSVVSGGVGGFNLLGNPYTSHINSATFLTENTSNLVTQDIWIWNQATENYEVRSTIDAFVLAPAQGFFVRASSPANLIFEETNQVNNGGTFKKSSKTEVKLMMNDGSANRFAKLYYLENVTKGFDNGFDGETFGGIENSVDVFTNLLEDNQGKKYQVQSLPISEIENMVIPVGVNAATGKEITFSADALNLPADIKVFLEDRFTNTFTRLDETNSEYQATLTESLNGVGRFYLHTAQSVLSTEDVILNSVRVFKTEASSLKITGLPQGKTSFYLYNILGKEMMTTIFTSNGNKEISLSKLTSGIYVAKMQTEKGAISKKIILE